MPAVRLAFWICCAGMMVLAIGLNLLPVFFTSLQSASGAGMQLSNEQLGRIMAVTFIGVVGAIVLTGPLADRWGLRRMAMVGSVLMMAGLLALGRSHTYAAVLAASAVMGIGAGTLDMVLSPIVGDLLPHNRAAAMNWLHSFYCIGAVVTVLLAGAARQVGIGWRQTAVLLAILPVLVTVGFALMRLPPQPPHHEERRQHKLRRLIRIPYFLAAMAAIALGGATEMGMAAWLPAYAERSLGYTPLTGAISLTAFLAMMALGRIGVGLIGRADNIRTVLLWCCGASVVLFIGASFARPSWLALACCIAAGLAGSALWPSMLAITADRFPHGGATMYAALAAAGNAGAVVMPWIVGWVTDHATMAWGLATAIGAPLLMGVVLLMMGPLSTNQTEPSLLESGSRQDPAEVP